MTANKMKIAESAGKISSDSELIENLKKTTSEAFS